MRHFLFIIIITLLFTNCNPPKADQYVESGRNMILKGQFKKAITDLNKAISIDSQNAEAYFLRGTARHNLRNIDSAIEDYTISISLDSENPEVFYNRGSARFFLGDRDGACADWIMADALGKPNIKDKIKGCKPLTH
ncbi:tetratricopeptide repeat protein [Bacteroidota bacterium]